MRTFDPRFGFVAMIAVLAAAVAFYELLAGRNLAHSGALFIGIPAILAMAAVFIPTGSAKGVAMKTVTLGLLTALVLLPEGILCIGMAAPLFYFVALLIGVGLDARRSPEPPQWRRLSSGILFVSLGAMTSEGVTPATTINRDATVSETRVVRVPAQDVERALRMAPRFDRALPTLLRRGFPRPIASEIGDQRWMIAMRGGETRLNGTEPKTGILVLELADQGNGFMEWRATSDSSHMTHFLSWRRSRVEWVAIDADTTQVTWQVSYERGLDPAWYFGPLERYAVRLAAQYLIDAVATP